MKKYSSVIFLVLLGIVFLAAIPGVTGAFMERWESTAGHSEVIETPIPTEEATVLPTDTPTIAPTDETPGAPEATQTPEATITPTPAPTPVPTPAPPVQFKPEKGVFTDVDASYFDDALFIGDSRTDDIYKYGTLKNATYYAKVGMSLYNLHNGTLSVPGVGTTSFSNLLTSRTFGKVYVMLGFNEAGYNKERTVGEMQKLVAEIRAAQPDALIFIEANLYVTKHTSDTDKFEHNDEIRYLNNRFSDLADGETILYIDVNPLFCDGEGNLKEEMTGDGHHVYAKYYKNWCAWLQTRGVVKIEPTEPPAAEEPTAAPTEEPLPTDENQVDP